MSNNKVAFNGKIVTKIRVAIENAQQIIIEDIM